MTVAESFENWTAAYGASIPWPWPCTMSDDEVETMSLVTGTKFLDGVVVYGEPRMRYDGTIRVFSVTVTIE